MEYLFWIVAIIIIWAVISAGLRKAKYNRMLEKYGDSTIAQRIIDRTMWQGQTEEQLIDSLGLPSVKDSSVLKTKTKDTWKYHQEGANRFALRIIVENGLVVGWKQKGD